MAGVGAGALSIISSIAQNYKPDKSVWSAGGASILIFAAGAVLVGVFGGIPAFAFIPAIPFTMTEVAPVAIAVGHFVASYVSPTKKQAIDQLAEKIDVDVSHLKKFIPEIQETYPAGVNGNKGDTTPVAQSNINPKQ